MKLIVEGNLIVMGKKADFSIAYEDLNSILGKRTSTAMEDVAFILAEMTPYKLSLTLIRGDTQDTLHLRPGQSVTYTHQGNAYEYLLRFVLEG